ncbi:EKC/KEOPS complex subunit Tprkb-like [Phymastichus coffea]|uniref:EKC/KEOPS complex subunit Tprkb-like n=1 Tax=Phymastichus coffea TaxID=108790 RepID=UPI00273B0A8C|nr:EKC/KEOPS complex subunit Tprkb-like [Phymastichus coffea]
MQELQLSNHFDNEMGLELSDGFHCKVLDIFSTEVSIYLYRNVDNMPEIHRKLVSKELSCCIVKANLVLEPLHVSTAVDRAVLNQMNGLMFTRNLNTEIIYYLSASKNILEGIQNFGVSDDTRDVLIIIIYTSEEKEAVTRYILSSIKGERIPIDRLYEFSDIELMKELYNIDTDELRDVELEDAIISRIGGYKPKTRQFVLPMIQNTMISNDLES